MNKHLLDKAIQEYIHAHLNADVSQIALSKSSFTGVTSAELSGQIQARKKSEKKLPTWFNTDGIYYPPTLSIEQTSSEVTAAYKAKLIKGDRLIDLTGGFGVDALYFSKVAKAVFHCEINEELSKIAAYNGKILGADNITFKAEDGLELIKKSTIDFDTIYIDPARRAEKGKVFMLKDCTPDVVSNLDLFLSKAKRIIIKTAPLLDLTAGFNELKQVSEVHIVSVKNECKEILWVLDQGFKGEAKIISSTINEHIKSFSFLRSELNTNPDFITEFPSNAYLYEPDVALLKSGAFNLIASRYNLRKLQAQTQLYSSANYNPEFPGRIFKIEEILSPGNLKKNEQLKGNVIVRNYPAKPEDLIKKYKIKPDQELFLIFTKIARNNNLIIKARIIQYY